MRPLTSLPNSPGAQLARIAHLPPGTIVPTLACVAARGVDALRPARRERVDGAGAGPAGAAAHHARGAFNETEFARGRPPKRKHLRTALTDTRTEIISQPPVGNGVGKP